MARKRGSKWQADVRTKSGDRLRPTFDTESQADAWEAVAKLAVDEGRPIPSTARADTDGHRLGTLGPLFTHTSRTEWANCRAAANLIRNGRTCVEHFGTSKDVGSITSADIAEFRIDLADSGLSMATINRKCAALSKMLGVAFEAKAISAVPKIKFSKEEQTKFRYLDDTEERVLLAYWSAAGLDDMYDLSILLLDTGARCFAEMTAARWDAFAAGNAAVTFWHTKTGRPRTVPLTKRSREVIERRRERLGNSVGPFTGTNKSSMRVWWDTMRVSLRFHDVTPHTMRHTCCTRLVLGGADIKRVMVWMGHSSVVTTMRYMQIKPDGLNDILGLLERKAA